MSTVSDNGDFLRIVAQWLDNQAASQKQKFSETQDARIHNTSFATNETNLDKAKYYLKQLWNAGGFSMLKLLKYMSNLSNIGLVDNKALRYLESVYEKLNWDDSRFVAWIKKHPSVSSYLSYYMAVALIGSGAFGLGNIKNNTDREKDNDSSHIVAAPEHDFIYEHIQKKDSHKIYKVSDENFINDFMNDYWADIVVCMLEFETYYGVSPTQNAYEKCHTYGPGLTYVYVPQANGGYTAHRCSGEYAKMAQNFSDSEIWEQCGIHIGMHHGTLHRIQKNLRKRKIEEISGNKIMALLIAGYQRPKDIGGIINKISNAQTLEKQCDAFAFYKIDSAADRKFLKGTMKRRWWCAAYYANKIDAGDLLDMECDVFVKPELKKLFNFSNRHFDIRDQVIEYAKSAEFLKHEAESRKNRNLFVGTVKDFIHETEIFDANNTNSISEKTKATAFYDATQKINRGRTYDATHLFISQPNKTIV